MDIGIKDLLDFSKSQTATCHRSGSDVVGGVAVITCDVTLEDIPMNSKVWVSARNLLMRTESSRAEGHDLTEHDDVHVPVPGGAV